MAYKNSNALAISEGILATFTNLLLFSLSWVGSSVGKTGSVGAYHAFEEAFEEIENINYATIKRAMYRLKRRGLVKVKKESDSTYLSLTSKGKLQLKSLLPCYSQPLWSGDIYLVIYDILEEKKNNRDAFRSFLKSVDCVMVQKSVWLTLYDQSEAIASFIKDNDMQGSVIVSQVSKNVHIGGRQMKKLVQKLYKIKSVNKRYKELLSRVRKKKKVTTSEYLRYLSIVKNDPCLPDEFLPADWKGKKLHDSMNEMVSVK